MKFVTNHSSQTVPNLQILGAGLLAIAYAIGITYIGSAVHLFGSLIVGLIGGAFLLGASLNAEFNWYKIYWFLLAYLFWQTVLLFTSSLPETSFTVYWLWCSFVLVAIGCAQLQKTVWTRLFGIFCLVGGFSAAWGLLEFFCSQTRTNGPIVDPNAWAAMLNLFFFGLASIYLREEKHRYWLLPILALFCLAMFSAYSRVGVAVFMVAGLFLSGVCASIKNLRKPALMLVGTALVSFVAIHGTVSQLEATHHTEGYTVDVSQHGWTQRFAMWRGTVEIAKDNPFFGAGPGTFVVQYPAHREPGDLRTLGYFAHNDYLQFLAEGGPILLLFLLLLVGWLGLRLVKVSFEVARGDEARVESLVLIVAIGTVLLHSLMNFSLYQIQIQMLAGLLLARLITLEGRAIPISLNPVTKNVTQISSVAIIFSLIVVAVLDSLSFELVYEREPRAEILDIRQDPGNYFDTVSFLASVRSGNSTNRLALATLYRSSFDQQVDQRARESLALVAAMEYKAAFELNPYHAGIRRFFAEFLEQNPELQHLPEIDVTPGSLFKEGVRLAPTHVESHLDLMRFLERQGEADSAYDVLLNGAFKWVHVRRGNFEENRTLVYKLLLNRATTRNDTEALEAIIESINFLQLTPTVVAPQQYQ